MTDDSYRTLFSGEIRVHTHEWENSYEVWVKGKLLKSFDTFSSALCYLYDYLTLVAEEERVKCVIAEEVLRQNYMENMPRITYNKNKK